MCPCNREFATLSVQYRHGNSLQPMQPYAEYTAQPTNKLGAQGGVRGGLDAVLGRIF